MTREEAEERMRLFRRRFASRLPSDLSVAVAGSWQRLEKIGDWAAVHTWIDRLFQLAEENYGAND